MQPFDQDRWAANYAAYDAGAALAVFSAVRAWNLALLRSLPAEAFARKVSHPERGEMTFQTIVETMGGHDLNHLKQLERIAWSAGRSLAALGTTPGSAGGLCRRFFRCTLSLRQW
jgi:hypothetical protein